MKLAFFLLSLAFAVPGSASTAGKQPVRITANTSASSTPDHSTISYRVDCTDRAFTLVIDSERRSASLTTPDVRESDIGKTPLGQRLLAPNLVGRLGFACWGKGLNVNFLGVDIKNSQLAQPVEFRGFLAPDGQVKLLLDVSPIPVQILDQVFNDAKR
jgi:hypothetical protein